MRAFIFLFSLFLSLGLTAIAPFQALERLMDGNERFRNDRSLHPDRTQERRLETASKQSPFAIIVGCSDSRVAPEILFDQGIGDLFIVRVAGNVVGPIELASIEYSAIYLHSAVVLVLGHENCGAVSAVIEEKTKDIEPIATLIQPAADQTRSLKDHRLEATVKQNVRNMVKALNQNAVLKSLVDKNNLRIQGGYYNFHTGKVELI